MVYYYALYTLLILAILKGIYNWIRAIILRISLYLKLGRICRKNGYALEKPRFIFASFFGYSPKPDIMIRTADTEYVIRLITCHARKRIYHFADHEWFVRALRFYFLMPFMEGETLTLFKRRKHLPPLKEEYCKSGSKVVLLFNPAPIDITYTTRTNRREIASSGTDFDGWLIYSAKSFTGLLADSDGR